MSGQLTGKTWNVRWLFALWLLMAVNAVLAHAETTVDIPPVFGMIDLGDAGTPIAANRKNLAIEVPGEQAGTRKVLELRGRGDGPVFNWTVFTIRNTAPIERKLVMLVEEQRFAGSGLLVLKPFGLRPQGVAFSSGQDTLERAPVQGGDAVTFLIKPNATVTFAIEASQTIRGVRLYSQQSFASREASLAFLRGAVIAIAGLIAFGVVALYGIRAHTAFIAGGFFALTAMGFMALEGGYLGNMAQRLVARGFPLDTVRAATESLFLLGLAVAVSAFNGLRQRGLLTILSVIVLLGLCLANLAYAYIEPQRATQIARIGFASLAVIAFVIGYAMRNSPFGVVRQAMFFWSALLIFVFLAAFLGVEEKPTMLQHGALLMVLAAVLAIMAFTLVRFAFAQGFLAKPFLTDASRRSLALAGAQHFVWDWQPYADRLDIGSDLARNLGYAPATWQEDPQKTFLSVLHPDDEPTYSGLLQARNLTPNSFHEIEFRLRDASNAYRWFALRARALPGANDRSARCIGTLTDITRNKVVEDRLITDAVHDPVTGLPSRAIFADRLAREIDKPLPLPVRVLQVGLERFKTLNDGLGHDIGDQLLLVAGQRIAECLSAEETAARLSGSQFAVMFIEAIAGRTVETLAEDIRRSLASPVQMGNREVYLTAAIGVSRSSMEGYRADDLQEQAVAALQEAQKQGRPAIRIYEASDANERASHVAFESDLRRAIDRHEIEVVYQPIINLENRTIAGLEALARWRHPQLGLLTPAKFMDVAEQAGMVPDISTIVLTEAARQMGIWQRTVVRSRPIYVAVNIPADQLTDTGFVERLRSLINREGLRPNAIKIEITESVAMRHPDRAQQFIQRLQALGIGVACDDFGTGFSSLSSLRDLPFDTLKIDRSFLLPEAIEGRGGIILDTVVALAHNLGMLVVGEGIESEAQAARLQMMGCDLGQGFHLAEPMAARDIQDLLAVLPRIEHSRVEAERPEGLTSAAPTEVAPEPGLAPMAPRQRKSREDDIFEEQAVAAAEPEPLPPEPAAPIELKAAPEPEILPSIFTVANRPKPFAPKPEPVQPTVKRRRSRNRKTRKAGGEAKAKS